MAAIAVTQSDLTAMELRVAAGREKDSAASRRMLALAMVLDGADRTSAAETCGMDRQTLRDWVHRYNATGRRAKLYGRQIAPGDCNRRHRSRSPSHEELIDSDF